MEKQIVQDFMRLYPSIIECSIQTFDDLMTRKEGKLARIFPIQTGWTEKCNKLQDAGAGVFFSVNPSEKGKRGKDYTTKIVSWICEIDDKPKDEQMRLFLQAPIYPSLIIESHKSYHAYYFAEDGDKDTYEEICGGLMQYFGSDPSLVKDWSKVLRVPGFYHQKTGEENRFMVTIKDHNGIKYTKKNMMDMFPYKPEEETAEYLVTRQKTLAQKGITVDKNPWEYMADWDHKDMLKDISGTWLTNGEDVDFKPNADGTEQIWVNKVSTGSWIDRQGMIGSHTDGGPTWIAWVMWYGNINKSDLLKRVIENYKNRFPDGLFDAQKNIEEARRVQAKENVEQGMKHISTEDYIKMAYLELRNTKPKDVIKWGWDEWDYHMGGIYTGKIYLIGAETGHGKTTWSNIVCNNISNSGHKVIKYNLEDRLEDKGKEEIFHTTNKLRVENGLERMRWHDFNNNEYGDPEGKYYDPAHWEIVNMAIELLNQCSISHLQKHKQVGISELEILIQQGVNNGCRFFLVDHLHYFAMEESGRRDLEIQNVMHRINDMVRNYNICIFLVAQYSNTTQKTPNAKPNPSWFKDGSAIKHVSNYCIQLKQSTEHAGATEFFITKYRGPSEPDFKRAFIGYFDPKTFTYDFPMGEYKKLNSWG